MRKTLILALSLLTLQGALTTGTGRPAPRRPNATRLPAAAPGQAKRAPLVYAVAVSDNVTQFGVLDIGTGVFHSIADLPDSAQGIGRDAEGKIYIVDQKNNLVRLTPGNGKIKVIGPTGSSKRHPSLPPRTLPMPAFGANPSCRNTRKSCRSRSSRFTSSTPWMRSLTTKSSASESCSAPSGRWRARSRSNPGDDMQM